MVLGDNLEARVSHALIVYGTTTLKSALLAKV
jgi:hypothetical protein